MTVLQFGPWLPDQADLNNKGVTVVKNAIPTLSGYIPVKDLVVTTNALDARPQGAFLGKDTSGNRREYAGDAAKLYENVSDTWTDRSIAGGYSTGSEERWEFVQWENKVIATNWDENPQSATFGDAAFADLTTDFRARHVAVVRDFVVFANTNDASDGDVPSRVRWSAFGDETDYTVSASTLSDFNDLRTEEILRIVGGEFGLVFQKNAVWRMTFIGAPVVFQFDEVLPGKGIGAISPGSVVRDGDVTYFLSDRGFVSITNGINPKYIGAERVDRFILDQLDTDNLHRISASVEPGSRRILWALPLVGNTGGRPNFIIVYDPSTDRWSQIEEEVEFIYPSGGVGTTLENVDNTDSNLDTLSIGLDDPFWKGSGQRLGVFDGDFKSGAFSNNTPKNATIETKEFEINEGRFTKLLAFRPLIEGGSVTAQVQARDRQIDTGQTFGNELTLRSSGRFTTRSNARYHKIRFNISGSWERAIGIQLLPDEARRGGLFG